MRGRDTVVRASHGTRQTSWNLAKRRGTKGLRASPPTDETDGRITSADPPRDDPSIIKAVTPSCLPWSSRPQETQSIYSGSHVQVRPRMLLKHPKHIQLLQFVHFISIHSKWFDEILHSTMPFLPTPPPSTRHTHNTQIYIQAKCPYTCQKIQRSSEFKSRCPSYSPQQSP